MNRFQFVADHRDAFEVKRLCAVLHVSRSSFYAWLAAAPARAARADADTALAQRIRAIHDTDTAQGAPRITAELNDGAPPETRVNHKRVARVMRQAQIAGLRHDPVLGQGYGAEGAARLILEREAGSPVVHRRDLGGVMGGPIGPGDLPVPVPVGEPDLEWPPSPLGPVVVVDGEVRLPQRPPRVEVRAVELTQSTQYEGEDGSRWGDPGAVPMVALKTTLVRVFVAVNARAVQAGTASAPRSDERVTGTLRVHRGGQEVFRTGPTNPTGTVLGYPHELDRVLFDAEERFLVSLGGGDGLVAELTELRRIPPLEFVVPGWYCRGTTRFTFESGTTVQAALGVRRATWVGSATFQDVPAPRINVVSYAWTSPTGAVTARPTAAEVATTMRLARRMFPVPYFDYEVLGLTPTTSGAYGAAAAGGGCNQSWNDLLDELELTRIFTGLFGLGGIVVGLIPAAVAAATATVNPDGSTTTNTGCGRNLDSQTAGVAGGGVAGCFAGDERWFAHELGHVFARQHVSTPGGNDPNYPAYSTGKPDSIGEIGIDVGARTVYPPRASSDVMSYGGNVWISPYTYQGILADIPNRSSVPARPEAVRPILIAGVRLSRDRQVAITRAIRLDAPAGAAVPRRTGRSPLSVDLLDAERRVLATHHLHRAVNRGGDCCGRPDDIAQGREPWQDVLGVLDWDDRVQRLVFHDGDETLAEVEPGEPPSVEIGRPRVTEGTVTFEWGTGHPRTDPHVVILYSADAGAWWTPLALDAGRSGRIEIPVWTLRGGDDCRFRLVASAEFAGAEAVSEPVTVPITRRAVKILAPSDGATLDGRTPVPLAATAYSADLGVAPPQDYTWESNLDGHLGDGDELTVRLSPGEHSLTVTAPDGLGDRGQATARVVVEPVSG